MGLKAIDDVLISLQQHTKFRRLSVPDKDVSTVATRHHVIIAPEIRFFDHSPKETRVKRGKAKDEKIGWADTGQPSPLGGFFGTL